MMAVNSLPVFSPVNIVCSGHFYNELTCFFEYIAFLLACTIQKKVLDAKMIGFGWFTNHLSLLNMRLISDLHF